ncbi:hypothetical protein [Cryobacterium sp. M91]|uniref:hypothetical protein n=1 Tax=Cryobacterium sp. M91 TaxID=2048294 RepID=UPI000CE39001|nr:hypothetical protein [Cryobacterium sp. M91]
MTEAIDEWPYPTVSVDGNATVDDDGENQLCECGNDSWAEDWRHADRDGNLSFEASGSSDPAEFTVCPVCGRVYTNLSLFDARAVAAAAVAQYDVSSPLFAAALARYDRDAYGATPPAGARTSTAPTFRTRRASSHDEEA